MKQAIVEALACTAIVSFIYFVVLLLITMTSVARGSAVPPDLFAALYRWLTVFAASLTGAIAFGRAALAS